MGENRNVNGDSNSKKKRKLETPSDGVFKMSVSAVLLFRSFFANLCFHFCLALIVFVFIIIVLQYLLNLYLQNSTQNHNTTSATTNNRVRIESVILFT